ncbi:solute carrier family 25 member 38 [Metarhizium robertsii ARSEF 23]|nr:solute carrier family 25 member 38 [Metarhizium robertsii ARSEF 23]KHO11381.1 solute carrier family 25 member 38 [Metarhizium robertsii ARSEF 23]
MDSCLRKTYLDLPPFLQFATRFCLSLVNDWDCEDRVRTCRQEAANGPAAERDSQIYSCLQKYYPNETQEQTDGEGALPFSDVNATATQSGQPQNSGDFEEAQAESSSNAQHSGKTERPTDCPAVADPTAQNEGPSDFPSPAVSDVVDVPGHDRVTALPVDKPDVDASDDTTIPAPDKQPGQAGQPAHPIEEVDRQLNEHCGRLGVNTQDCMSAAFRCTGQVKIDATMEEFLKCVDRTRLEKSR